MKQNVNAIVLLLLVNAGCSLFSSCGPNAKPTGTDSKAAIPEPPLQGAGPARELSPERSRQILVDWFECEECTEGQLDAVLKLGPGVVPSLAGTLREGPPPASIKRLRLQLARSYEHLSENERAHPKGWKPMERDDYVNRHIANYVARYESRAAIALGKIGSREALAALRAAATANLREDVRAVIQRSLDKR